MKILLADDNVDDTVLLATRLTGQGHQCTSVHDGEAALEYLRQERPDLIISDILMPKLDGFALCRSVKRDPAWRDIYFIFCTATYTDEPDASLALQLGAQRFLTKPLDFDRLQTVLAEIEAGSAVPVTPIIEPTLAEPAYLELYNARLVHKLSENYRQVQTVLAELRRQNEQLWRFTEASQSLNEAVGETAVTQTIVQRLLELVQAETALLILLEEGDLIIRWAVGRSGGLLQGLVFPATGSLWNNVLSSREMISFDAAMRQALAARLFLDVPGSAVCAPLRVRDALLGFLIALHHQPDRFDTNTLQTCQLFAQQAAVAWENARLVTRLQAQAEALRQSQGQLIHEARMSTVGRLTAALAHEMNNPLQSILGGVQFVLEQAEPEWRGRPYLELAAAELDRLSDILQRMVGFYRRDPGQRQPTAINPLISETLSLAEKPLQRHHIAVITDFAHHLPLVSLAPNQFKQVFLNLILNAADAMPQGGQLEITSRLDEQGRLELCFRDSGPGIPLQELERIFESFYTTKPHGTGLGLAISRDIVQAHGGQLLAESEPGQGATFWVLLPCYPE